VDSKNGAENTKHALFISNRENTASSSGSFFLIFFYSKRTCCIFQFFTDPVASESTKNGYGSLFSLVDLTGKGTNYSNNIIGVFFGYSIMHGSNFIIRQ
jgi:hypothetical protein